MSLHENVRWQGIPRLKVGFIGSGTIMQQLHLPSSQKIHELEPVAIYGRDVGKLKELAKKFSIPFIYSNWQNLLEKHELDIAIIALPPKFHASVSKEALLRGMHVLLEKPAVLNVSEGEELMEIAKRNNRLVVVNMPLRFLSMVKTMQELIKGYLGITFSRAEIEYNISKPLKKWYYDLDLAGGGISLSIGIHAIDLICYLLEKPTKKIEFVSCKKEMFSKIEDEAVFNIYFSEDEKCRCSLSWLRDTFSVKIILQGNNNLLEFLITPRGPGEILLNGKICQKFYNIWGEIVCNNALINLVNCINGKNIPISSLEEHLLILNPLLTAYSNFRKGNKHVIHFPNTR